MSETSAPRAGDAPWQVWQLFARTVLTAHGKPVVLGDPGVAAGAADATGPGAAEDAAGAALGVGLVSFFSSVESSLPDPGLVVAVVQATVIAKATALAAMRAKGRLSRY